jgi:phenylalanyl-tRNA synthetase beta chain
VKILVSWLRDFVDVPGAPRELAWALHVLGFELAAVDSAPGAASDDEDAVIDLEITANRPDCLSVIGIAREVATRFGVPLRMPALRDESAPGGVLPLKVTIEAPDLCPRYVAAMADVRIASSPPWIVARLAAAGVRAINNVVDVTNYVLLELGHPMHAFDYDRLAGAELVIRRARPGERVTTLDAQERALADDMLVIADADRTTAIAGVMGGLDSEVSLATRVIALESAYFSPTSIRRTSRRLALSTEASYRFERGADPDAPAIAMRRALELMEEIGAGKGRPGFVDVYPRPVSRPRVELRERRVAAVLGHAVAADESERILSGLGFVPVRTTGDDGARWTVEVPGWRGDVSREADLIEEIARHAGYDRLPTSFPPLLAAPAAPDPRLERDRIVEGFARASAFSECCTFTFVEREAAAPFAADGEIVPIANPLSEKFAVLRPSVLTGVIDSVAHNRRREQRDVRLFEIGSRFTRSTGETRALALAWTGAGSPEHWSGTGRPVDFFDIKGAVETICSALGLGLHFEVATPEWLVPGRAAVVSAAGSDAAPVPFGVLGQLSPSVAAARGLPPHDEVYVAEIDLDAVANIGMARHDVTVRSLPRYPSVVRDISILVSEGLPAATLRATIQAIAPPTLVGVREFARYQGKGIPEGRVSLSFRLTYRSPERTLTDEEAQAATDAIVAALGSVHGATLR